MPLAAGEVGESVGRHFHFGFEVADEDEADPAGNEGLDEALEGAAGNKAEAARALGLARSTLVSKLKKYGIP